MAYKYGCDMRGMLSFQIMWLLSKRQMHGEEIAREIEKRRGDKPKAGTLYPALKELKEARLIKGRKSGKVITYSLTPSGNEALKHAIRYFCRSFGDVFNESK
ncbi:MAG TPA: PadR family transcriptional regulator [Candidatus Acidoferrum sp.]|nr:PadR family transcriptional regulator [Candidatus Acidoferrum sp.]